MLLLQHLILFQQLIVVHNAIQAKQAAKIQKIGMAIPIIRTNDS